MKNYEVAIDKEKIYKAVYNITANAAAQRGDGLRVATEDNDILLDEFLEKGGAAGFSTFMAYYILKADAMAGGKDMLSIMKEYFGAMH